jgi:hypothetical protein
MKRCRYLVLGAVLTITGLAGGQTSAPPSRQPGGTGSAAGTVNASPQSQLLRILTPVASQQFSNNAITFRFELVNPAAYAGTPNFLIQLDGTEPVRTTSTEKDFTGLTAGVHNITVILVDANDSPIPGGRASVQFTVASQTAQPSSQTSMPANEEARKLKLGGYQFQKLDPEQSADPDLPKASSPLPLISVIGFGILVGGIVSALKTRS